MLPGSLPDSGHLSNGSRAQAYAVSPTAVLKPLPRVSLAGEEEKGGPTSLPKRCSHASAMMWNAASSVGSAETVQDTWVYRCFLRHMIHEDDTPDVVARKAMLLPPCAVVFAVQLFYLVYVSASPDADPAQTVLAAAASVSLASVLVKALLGRLEKYHVIGVCTVLVLVSITADLFNSGIYDHWVLVVLLMDVMLIIDASVRLSWLLVATTTLWILAKTAEDAKHFGMYEAVAHNTEDLDKREDYGYNWGATAGVIRIGVFLCDYTMTRRFAMQAKREQHKVQASVDLAERIAAALVRFDLEDADMLIAGEAAGDFDLGLMHAFRSLVDNLAMYRPYLPQSLFHTDQEGRSFADSPSSPAARSPTTAAQSSAPHEADGDSDSSVRRETSEGSCSASLPTGVRHRTFLRGGTHRFPHESRMSGGGSIPSPRLFGSLKGLLGREGEEQTAARRKVQDRLDAVSTRKGTLLRVCYDPDSQLLPPASMPPDETFETSAHSCAATFAEQVLESVREASDGGVVFELRAQAILAGWNTHAPAPRHAMSACRAALNLSDRLVPLGVDCYSAAASGSLCVGHIGTWQRAPVVLGHAAAQVVHICPALSYVMQSRLLVTEPAYDAVQGMAGWLVDIVPDDPGRTMRGQPPGQAVGVYELAPRGDLSPQEKDLQSYAEGWSALRLRKYTAAVHHFTEVLQNLDSECALMRHAVRALRVASAAAGAPPGVFPVPYVRTLTGWEDMERHGGEVADDVTQLLSQSMFSVPPKTPLLPRRCDHFSSPLLPDGRQDTLSPQGPQSPLGRGPERDVLQAEIRSEFKRRSVCVPRGRNNEVVPEDTESTEFTDRQGSVWRRSDKMLGRGSFGEVWLGMSEEGALVAMKMQRLGSIPAARGRRQSAARSATKASGSAGEETAFITCSWAPGATAAGQGGGETEYGTDNVAVEHIEELLKEVDLMSSLKHDNIVAYLSSCVACGCVVICMEYVPGGSLQSVLEQFKVLSVTSVRRYTKDILRGLAFLHGNGIVHRDFKPGNVLLQIDGQCKLADFGASATLGDVGRVVGTLLYMAPEACRGEAIAASDCWGVGIAVVQMLTGKVPYNTSNFEPATFLYRMARVDPEALPQLDAQLCGSASEFVSGCLRVDAEQRPSADELLLHAFLNV